MSSIITGKILNNRLIGSRGSQGVNGNDGQIGSQGNILNGDIGDIGTPGPTCACRLDEDANDVQATGASNLDYLVYNSTQSEFQTTNPDLISLSNINFQNINQYATRISATLGEGGNRLWRANNDEQIRLTYDSSFRAAVENSGPTGYFRLDELSGSTEVIDVINGISGTVVGPVTFEQDGLINGGNKCIDFNGGGGINLQGKLFNYLTTDWSVELVFNTAISGYDTIISGRHGNGSSLALLYLHTGFNPARLGSIYTGVSALEVQPNTTYHCVMTYDHVTYEINYYLNYDGTNPSNTDTVTRDLNVLGSSDPTDIGIASYTDIQKFGGRIDEVAFYERILTEQEVIDHYEAFLKS